MKLFELFVPVLAAMLLTVVCCGDGEEEETPVTQSYCGLCDLTLEQPCNEGLACTAAPIKESDESYYFVGVCLTGSESQKMFSAIDGGDEQDADGASDDDDASAGRQEQADDDQSGDEEELSEEDRAAFEAGYELLVEYCSDYELLELNQGAE